MSTTDDAPATVTQTVALIADPAPRAGAAGKDLGWILLAFAIFNTYMLIFSTQVNVAVFAVFLTLELTEIFLAIGGLAGNANITKVGGVTGIITAAAAWYASAAGVINGMKAGIVVPVGRPLLNLQARPVIGR